MSTRISITLVPLRVPCGYLAIIVAPSIPDVQSAADYRRCCRTRDIYMAGFVGETRPGRAPFRGDGDDAMGVAHRRLDSGEQPGHHKVFHAEQLPSAPSAQLGTALGSLLCYQKHIKLSVYYNKCVITPHLKVIIYNVKKFFNDYCNITRIFLFKLFSSTNVNILNFCVV